MIDRNLNYGRHLIEKYLREAAPYSTVLDLGAGEGTDLGLAARVNTGVVRYAVEGYEVYAKKLEEQGIAVFRQDIEHDSLPLGSGSIDVVIANQIFEHTKEIFWVMHEVSRVLNEGGKLIMGVPNLAALHNRFLLLMGRQPSPIKTCSAHIRGFTLNDFLHFLNVVWPGGYQLKSFGGSNFYPFPPLIAKPLAKAFPTMAWGVFMLLEKQRPYNREFLDFPVSEQLETNFYLGEK